MNLETTVSDLQQSNTALTTQLERIRVYNLELQVWGENLSNNAKIAMNELKAKLATKEEELRTTNLSLQMSNSKCAELQIQVASLTSKAAGRLILSIFMFSILTQINRTFAVSVAVTTTRWAKALALFEVLIIDFI